MGGALIHFEESMWTFNMAIALVNNTFRFVHSYLNTNIFQGMRAVDKGKSDTLGTNNYLPSMAWDLNVYYREAVHIA